MQSELGGAGPHLLIVAAGPVRFKLLADASELGSDFNKTDTFTLMSLCRRTCVRILVAVIDVDTDGLRVSFELIPRATMSVGNKSRPQAQHDRRLIVGHCERAIVATTTTGTARALRRVDRCGPGRTVGVHMDT